MAENKKTKQEYIETLKDIINNEELSKEDIRLSLEILLTDSNTIEMRKCPNMSNTELSEEMEKIKISFYEFVKGEDENLSQHTEYIDINERNLIEAIVRTFKRKEYYKYFHNIDSISELKQASLLCFWIMKLKPFTVLLDDSLLRASVNEKFALNIILSTIQYLVWSKGLTFKMPDRSLIQDIIYSFKYRDLSKEAIMMLSDSLAYSQGISIDTWI